MQQPAETTGVGLPAGLLAAVRIAELDAPLPRSVFVMMRYGGTEQSAAIEQSITDTLKSYGLVARLAKDKAYSDDPWENVRVYMHASQYGIAIFEEIDQRAFNPNVAMEVGYMYALGRRLLLLKERRMPAMPTDIVGRIYRSFDSYKIPETMGREVRQWIERDLGIHATPRVLVFDQDQSVASAIERWLITRIEWQARTTMSVEELISLARSWGPDTISLEMRGDTRVLAELRAVTTAPILVLTPYEGVAESLEAGADDFLLKRFDIDEFAARIQALVRRARGDWPSPRFRFG